MGKWTVILSAWLAASLWLPAAQAAEDNLYFSGTLVNEPCVLAVEDELIELDFKTVIDKDLYLNGRTTGHPIKLHLNNCDVDVGKRLVNITFSGNESSEPKGLLVLQSGSVEGLLVGLETTSGMALPLNHTHRMGELASGDNVISLKAFLQAEPKALTDHSIGLGSFYAALTFNLSYE